MENTIPAHGVRRSRSTPRRKPGSTPCLDMPYSRREAIIMLISTVLATAKIEMNAKMVSIGMFGAPTSTTVSSGVVASVSRPIGTTATAITEIST